MVFFAATFYYNGEQLQSLELVCSSSMHDGCGAQWVPAQSLHFFPDGGQACMEVVSVL